MFSLSNWHQKIRCDTVYYKQHLESKQPLNLNRDERVGLAINICYQMKQMKDVIRMYFDLPPNFGNFRESLGIIKS